MGRFLNDRVPLALSDPDVVEFIQRWLTNGHIAGEPAQ